MTDDRLEESWRLLSRTRGVGLVLRVLIVVGPLASIVFTRLAAGYSVPAVNLVVIGLAVACVVVPDSNLGLLVVLLVGIVWLATVHDPATPWSVAVAMSIAVFHTAMAAASVAPPAARWSRAMCRRWMRRSVAVMAASAGTWAAMAAINIFDIPSSSVLVTASLLALAIAAVWARDGTLGAAPSSAPPVE